MSTQSKGNCKVIRPNDVLFMAVLITLDYLIEINFKQNRNT